jgi:hypothetical protein
MHPRCFPFLTGDDERPDERPDQCETVLGGCLLVRPKRDEKRPQHID